MKQKIKSMFFYLPKMFIFGLALLNFFYIFSQLKTGKLSFSEVTPWYEKSVLDVLILLLASISLLVSKRVSYLISGIMSGYVVIVGIFFLFFRKMSLPEQWQDIQEYKLNIFLQWEIQFILAVIIFGFTMFHLISDVLNKNNSQKRLIVGVSVALLMFVVGLSASWFYPTFTMTGSIPCDDSYCIYYFQPTMSSDYQAIVLYNEFTSVEKSHYLFESNL